MLNSNNQELSMIVLVDMPLLENQFMTISEIELS